MNSKRVLSLTMGLLPVALMAQDMQLTPAQQTLVAEIPTTGAERAREIFTTLGADADTLVPEFASKLTTEKSDADTTARYALGGLVWTIGHSGSAEQKTKLANLIADAIAKTEGVEPKSFLIEQLQFLGDPSIAEKLYPFIADDELGPRTIRTLGSLKPEGLDAKLVAALDDAKTTDVKAGILLSLAGLAPADAVAKITEFASDSDADVKEAALNALAAIGDPQSRDLLKTAAAESTSFYDQLAPARYLDYATVIAGKNQANLAAEICREIIAMELAAENIHLRGLALTALADILKEKSLDDQFAHVNDDPEDVRAIALSNINRFKDAEVTKRITESLAKSPDAEVTVAILLALGDRKDASALPAVTGRIADADPVVAATAVHAAGEIDRAAALPALLEATKSDKDKTVLAAIKEELLRVKPELLLPAVAQAVAGATVNGQVVLIEVLGERRATSQKDTVYTATASESAAVRSAAYEALGRVAEAADLPRLRDTMLSAEKNSDRTAARKAFVAAAKDSQDAAARTKLLVDSFAAADEKGKETLLEVMAAVADKDTIPLVVETANTAASETVKDAAVRSLSDWQSEDATTELLKIVEESKVEKHQVLAIRGISRIASGSKEAGERAGLLKKILPKAKRPDEQKAILTQLADIQTTNVFKIVATYVGREAVAAEAGAAAVKIAMPDRRSTGLRGALVAETLEKALPSIADKEKRAEVHKYIYDLVREIYREPLPEDSEGFGLLFNGKNLDGWVGDTDGYTVENGVLVCKADSGGKIFTERQFGDYVMRFEFKIPNGANNGVGIRTPIAGDPAYSGMEIQILDDHDPQYKDIKEWQRHGSVYGVSPAKPTQLKIGEWNTEEISVIGRNIKVTLNGEVINEVNLDDAKAKGFLSGKEHPGVDRNRGHIAFLGHGHKVEFRNVRIKNVANEAVPEGYTSLFNGENLDGWKGLVTNPIKRKAMSPEDLKKALEKADREMNDHWSVQNGILFFDGEGSHLCTTKDYGNFEMLVDWAITPYGDNGIYLRGTPQVQIWDPAQWPQGSGGLYNNKEGTSDPLVLADNPIGQWNQFRIKMVDDKVTVHLNDKLVVDNVTLENYWDRKLPIFPIEQIELQSHGSPAWFRNIYIKELP